MSRLDPIVSLSVAVAEAPGAIACLLGAGVSKDADVPLASEIVRDLQHRLFAAHDPDAEQPDAHTLDEWLREHDLHDLAYSQLMEEALPDRAVRREVLASYFAGKEPGATHELLADLAATGHIRVFVTTNFDPLLEWALQARGLDPVVVSSDDAILNGVPREHSRCYVVKPHGDYTEVTLRNTPEELAALPDGITTQLAEIFSRFGLLVLGYSGSDEAIGKLLTDRHSHYGVWWQTRSTPEPTLATLLDRIGARTITRSTSAELLRDLSRRLHAFRRAPNGDTPGEIHDELLGLIRRQDTVGAEEFRRVQRQRFRSELAAAAAAANHAPPAEGAQVAVDNAERLLAMLLPLARYDSASFEQELRIHADFLAQGLPGTNTVHWIELAEWSTWLALNTLGPVLLYESRWDTIGTLGSIDFTARIHDRRKPMLDYSSVAGYLADHVVSAPPEGKKWKSAQWQHLLEFASVDWIVERFPELDGDQGKQLMMRFNFVATILLGGRAHPGAFWGSSSSAEEFARQLRVDTYLRTQIAQAAGFTTDLDEPLTPFIERLSKARKMIDDPFGWSDAIEILQRS